MHGRMIHLLAICVFGAAAIALTADRCSAGRVVTLDGTLSGEMSISGGQLKIARHAVDFGQVLLLETDAALTQSEPYVVHFKDGQQWPVRIDRLVGKKLHLRSSVIGECDVEVALVRAIDFVANGGDVPKAASTAATPGGPIGVLSLDGAEPLPGSILWIDADRIAMQSPLGIIAIPRGRARRFLFSISDEGKSPGPIDQSAAPPSPPGTGDDDLYLRDGGIYRGKISIVAAGVELEAAMFNRISIPQGAIRGIVRDRAHVHFIDELPHQLVIRDLSGADKPGELVATASEAPLRQLLLAPGSALTIPTGAARFICTIATESGGRGDATLEISAAGKSLWRGTTRPGQEAQAVAIDIPGGADLRIEAKPAGAAHFPCGVVLNDAIIAARP